jgi:hypothetical protein
MMGFTLHIKVRICYKNAFSICEQAKKGEILRGCCERLIKKRAYGKPIP